MDTFVLGRASTLLVDVHKLDLTFVVELACGRGRHAERLINRLGTGRYLGTDILLSNVEACRERVGRSDQIAFYPTDGISLPLPDKTATALFCYDAMVHFDIEIIIAYLRDTARILSPPRPRAVPSFQLQQQPRLPVRTKPDGPQLYVARPVRSSWTTRRSVPNRATNNTVGQLR